MLSLWLHVSRSLWPPGTRKNPMGEWGSHYTRVNTRLRLSVYWDIVQPRWVGSSITNWCAWAFGKRVNTKTNVKILHLRRLHWAVTPRLDVTFKPIGSKETQGDRTISQWGWVTFISLICEQSYNRLGYNSFKLYVIHHTWADFYSEGS